MLSLDAARKMAKEYVEKISKDFALINDPISEGNYGWVFGYQSKKYLKTGAILDALAGNAPLLVDKHEATLHELGTAHSVEHYVKNHTAFGDPHKVASAVVRLVSRGKSVHSYEAIKSVRHHSEIGLAASKRQVEKCLAGEAPCVECRSVDEATKLVSALTELGYVAKQLGA